MSQQPTLRRAKPLDVVNLYRLLSKQGKNDSVDRSDEARALAFVLDTITTGFVLVAEKAGRIVGTIGFRAVRTDRGIHCGGTWFSVIPPYRDALPGDLLDVSLRAADHNGFAVRFPSPAPFDEEVLTAAGFKLGDNEWIRKRKNKKNAADKGRIPNRNIRLPTV
jgi:N-acetylglutamate synthase-like GNAT family acetyltransferase